MIQIPSCSLKNVLLVCSLAGMATGSANEIPMESHKWLTQETRRQLEGSKVESHNGVMLQTPDGVGHYKALWTRDFYYQYRYSGGMIDDAQARESLEYLLEGQRADGCMPDRVRADGRAVYSPGGIDKPLADHAVDNAPFLAMTVCDYVRRSEDLGFFRRSEPALRKGMDHVRRASNGLVYNPPAEPQCVYGFTDIVAKTGHLLFTSLLYYKACEDMAYWCEKTGTGDASDYRQQAELIRKNIGQLWDEESGMFWAADKDCRQHDIWGSAYAIDVGLASDEQRNRIIDYFVEHEAEIVQRGQIRHLPGKEVWQRMFMDAHPLGSYQNGAFWATPLAWVIPAIGEREPKLAWKWAKDAVADAQAHRFAECINGDTRKVRDFVVSATNLYYACRWLQANAPMPKP